MDLDRAQAEIRRFVNERDWSQFHSAENLAKSISIEAAELLECFQWGDNAEDTRVRDELADVLTYCLMLADKNGWDPVVVILEKLERTKAMYPIERAKGTSRKYDELPD